MDIPRYTPQIQRYNLKIIQYWKWMDGRVPPSHIEYEEPLVIETLVSDEPRDLDIAENLEIYLQYLEARKAIWRKGFGFDNGFPIGVDEHYIYPDTFSIN